MSASDTRTGRDGLAALCTCADCPTYTECMRENGELLFCMTRKSPACMFETKTCICPSCPVVTKYRFGKMYYCVLGSERERE